MKHCVQTTSAMAWPDDKGQRQCFRNLATARGYAKRRRARFLSACKASFGRCRWVGAGRDAHNLTSPGGEFGEVTLFRIKITAGR